MKPTAKTAKDNLCNEEVFTLVGSVIAIDGETALAALLNIVCLDRDFLAKSGMYTHRSGPGKIPAFFKRGLSGSAIQSGRLA